MKLGDGLIWTVGDVTADMREMVTGIKAYQFCSRIGSSVQSRTSDQQQGRCIAGG